MKKILVLRDIPEYKRRLQKAAPEWEIIFAKDKKSAKAHIPEAEIIVGWSSDVREELRNKDTNIKWVQNFSAGVDNLPLDEIKESGIYLTNAKGVHPKQLSESIFAMMLGLVRGIPKSLEFQSKSEWRPDYFSGDNLFEIHGKTIGILGTGVIGEEVARIARAFTMRTLGYRRVLATAPYIDEMYTQDQLHEMLSKCDYIVNIMPLTDKTRNMIGKEQFAAMPEGSRYFNFGRGETTNTDALIEALKSGHLAGAGLDVVAPEPLPKDSELWGMDNVIIAPHIAGLTSSYMDRAMDIFIESLKGYIENGVPGKNVINLDEAY